MLKFYEEDKILKPDKILHLSEDDLNCYIDKIYNINTIMRITTPKVFFDNLVSFEIFEKMWWTKYYNDGKSLSNLKYGYFFYLLDTLLAKYNCIKRLVNRTGGIIYKIENNELFICNNRKIVKTSMEQFLDYLGNTPFENWGENIEQMALQNKD